MKKYLKSKTLGLSLLALTGLLTSCESGKVDESKWTDAGTITVTWWNNYADPAEKNISLEEARTNRTYNEYCFAYDVIQEFEALHPNIKVNMSYKGSYSQIASEIKSGIATGNYPTIASSYPDNVAVYVNNGISYDVKDLIDDSHYGFGKRGKATATYTNQDSDDLYEDDSSTSKDDFSSSFLSIEKSMYNDHLYSMPYSKSSEALYVNQDILDKEGAGATGTSNSVYTAPVAASSKTKYTLDANGDGKVSFFELIEVGRKAKADYPTVFTDAKDSKGYLTACPIIWDSAENLFITACEALGIPYVDANGDGVAKQVLFKNDDAKKVVSVLKGLYDEGVFCTKNQLYYSDETKGYHQYPTQLLHDGKAVAIISSTAGARYVADDGFTATISEVPTFSKKDFGLGDDATQNLKAISQGPSLTFFANSDPRVPRAAFEFYKFLTNSTNSATLAKKTSYFPIRTSSNNTIVSEYASVTAKADVYTKKMFELNNTYNSKSCNFMTAAFTYSAASRTAVGNLLDAVLFSNTDVNTAFDNAYSTVVSSGN